MIANVTAYLNNIQVDVMDLEIRPSETIDSPNVVAQANTVFGTGNWDKIEINRYYE